MKNSIRHNLSLHNRFRRVQSEGTGKSSWWMINPDEKATLGNGTSSSTGTKQPRRRLGQGTKSSSSSSSLSLTNNTQKRLRTARSTKTSRTLTSTSQLDTPGSQQVQSSDMSGTSVYDVQPWNSNLSTDNSPNRLYEPKHYSTSVNNNNTPSTNNNGNSTACLPSTYLYNEVTNNYIGTASSNNNSNHNHTGDYTYHHHPTQTHHFHPHPHTLYQRRTANYDTGSTSGYYQSQSVLNDHHSNPCSLPLDTYHPTNPETYSLQQQQQIDPNDEQIYIRGHSTSSHSSSASLSPPTLTNNTNTLHPSSGSSSSSNYIHPVKTSSSSPSVAYLHPISNGTVTLYSHHHQHLSRHPPMHHPDIETVLHLTTEDDEMNDDEGDLSTLVHHHHGMIDEQQQLSTFFPNHNYNHPIHSHNDTSTSLLRTVLKRPIVGKSSTSVSFPFSSSCLLFRYVQSTGVK